MALAVLLFAPPPGIARHPADATNGETHARHASTTVRPMSRVDFGLFEPSPEARYIADWIADSGDNQRLSFAILDKLGCMCLIPRPT